MMKRISALLAAALLGCALLAGCGGGGGPGGAVRLVPSPGENEQLRLSNGVLVLHGGRGDVLHGGDLELLDGDIPPAAAFLTEYYLAGDGEERTLLSMQSVDQTGGVLDPAGSTGSIAGDLSGRFYEGWQDELWLELTVTDRERADLYLSPSAPGNGGHRPRGGELKTGNLKPPAGCAGGRFTLPRTLRRGPHRMAQTAAQAAHGGDASDGT